MTPYERGYADGHSEQVATPNMPRGNASWAEKLYARGFTDGRLAKCAAAANQQSRDAAKEGT